MLARARSVGPHRRGGLLLLPEIDGLEGLRRLEQAERENVQLRAELEEVGIVLLAVERLGDPTVVERLLPLEELTRSFGRDEPGGE